MFTETSFVLQANLEDKGNCWLGVVLARDVPDHSSYSIFTNGDAIETSDAGPLVITLTILLTAT
jgi:hypothetical protein